MPIACTQILRSTISDRQDIQLYQALAPSNPPCFWHSPNGTLTIDFTDPRNVVHRASDGTVQHTPIAQGDLVHGFPNPNRMTNVSHNQWNKKAVCMSGAKVWILEGAKWTATVIGNVSDELIDFDRRNASLFMLFETMELWRFLPSREACTTILCYRFTVSIQQPTSRATRQISTTTNADASESSLCKICVSDDKTIARSGIIPCGHVACSDCIEKALKDRNKCPFCRGKVDGLLRLFE